MRCPSLTELPPPPSGKVGWPWTEETPPLPDTMPDGRPWPKFSIVTPNYNFEKFLEITIRSVLLQGYPNLEYIVIDGGSTDGSVAIIRKYEKWLAHWISERDSGAADASNKGFRKATGELLAWLGSDDVYTPGALGVAASELRARPDCSVINGDFCPLDADRRVLKFVPTGQITLGRMLRYWVPCFMPPTPAIFFRRKLIDEFGGFTEGLVRTNDYDFWLRIIQKYSFHYVPHLFTETCVHPASMGGQGYSAYEAEASVVGRFYRGSPWHKHFWQLWMEESYHLTKRLGSSCFSAAWDAEVAGRNLRCWGWLLLAVVISPRYAFRAGALGVALRSLIGETRTKKLKQWLGRT
ncbi:MAG: glycosyltransferase family 2 protein [Verrucomicrobiia bacterium]